MKKKIRLEIPVPCNQRFKDMQLTEKGRFCSSCEKHIVDFSRMSDIEIIRILNETKGKVCGQFRPEQLNRPLQHTPKKASIFPQLLLGSALSFGFTEKTEVSNPVTTYTSPLSHSLNTTKEPKNPQSPFEKHSENYIKGKVVSKDDGEKLIGVSISIKGTSFKTTTNANGEFKLSIPETLKGQTIILLITYIGFESRTIKISTKKLPLKKDIELELNSMTLGVVMIAD